MLEVKMEARRRQAHGTPTPYPKEGRQAAAREAAENA